MAQTRKDLRGRVLRKGESQRRSDGRYVYTYTDPLGRRKYVYAQDLVTLWEKEAQLIGIKILFRVIGVCSNSTTFKAF